MHQLFNKRILVIVGNYGSGKTELSLNLALKNAKENPPAALVDLDIVNPYFRSAEQEAMLAEAGVRVLKPNFAMTTVDIPSLPAEIITVFTKKDERVVFDVGGDDTGAAALGRYAPYFAQDDVASLFVVNTCRPLTHTADDVLDLMERVQNRSRLPLQGLVHNSNLAQETTPETLLESRAILEEISARSGLPIVLTCALPHLESALPEKMRETYFPMQIFMRPEWM